MLTLQGFLAEHASELLRIEKPVPIDYVGALTGQAPDTIVFENVDGYPGWRIVDQLFATRQAQARVLGCGKDEVVQRLAEVLRAGPRPLVEVDDAPCRETMLLGDDVDLSVLPVVTHTDLDPYPYTTSFVVHTDPDTGSQNLMFPRCGVMGPNRMVTSYVTSTANRLLARHREVGTPMPQAVVIGAHPAWELAGVYSHPHSGWWEAELFETITGHPGEVVRCKTLDLLVPADASVVIEGFVSTEERAQDGPSPGPTMLFTPWSTQQPVFDVTAITMRRTDRVYRNHQMTPWTDHQELPRLMHEAIIFEKLAAMGARPRTVHFTQAGGALMCVIQIDPTQDGQARDAILATLGSTWPNVKMVVAVDPDIDPYDERDLLYAMATRVDPARDVIVIPGSRGWIFDPSATVIEDASPGAAASRTPSVVGTWGIDCTKPPPYRAGERANYERAWPKHWAEVRLEDFTG